MKTIKLNLKFIFSVAVIIIGSTGIVHATAMIAQEGLDKITTNLENSKANLNDHQANLGVVTANITEVAKSKVSTQKEKDVITNEILKNNEALKKVILQEKELQQMVNQETQDQAEEEKKIQELTKVLADLEAAQKKRHDVIEDYKKQIVMVNEEKTAWKSREANLREQENGNITVLRNIATVEVNLANKKKSYEAAVAKWALEVRNQQKIYDSYQRLRSK